MGMLEPVPIADADGVEDDDDDDCVADPSSPGLDVGCLCKMRKTEYPGIRRKMCAASRRVQSAGKFST